MPAISPEDWRRMTTGPEYAFYKNVLADDPETAPRIPLGQAIENAGTAALKALGPGTTPGVRDIEDVDQITQEA